MTNGWWDTGPYHVASIVVKIECRKRNSGNCLKMVMTVYTRSDQQSAKKARELTRDEG
jgi:hypothetical protein